jgi:hypothetical protein
VLTVIAVVLVVSFGALCYWQVTRALSGNSLSWAYVFEWPLFAGYVLYMWWRLSHERVRHPTAGAAGVASGGDGGAPAQPELEEEDEELAAYNRYLAALEQSGRRKRW